MGQKSMSRTVLRPSPAASGAWQREVMGTRSTAPLPEPRVVIRGEFGSDVTEMITKKLAPVARHAHGPVLDIQVRLSREPDPELPVLIRVDLDVRGRLVHAEVSAQNARDATDRVVERLIRQLETHPPERRRRSS